MSRSSKFRHLPTSHLWLGTKILQTCEDMLNMLSCTNGKQHRSTQLKVSCEHEFIHIKIYHDFFMKVFLRSVNPCCCGVWHLSNCSMYAWTQQHNSFANGECLRICHFGALSPHAGGREIPQLSNIDPCPFQSSPKFLVYLFSMFEHGSLNVPIEHHPTIRFY